MKLILLGGPGSGKGTQAELLSKALSIPSISTGDIFRKAIDSGTEVGKVVASTLMQESSYQMRLFWKQSIRGWPARTPANGYILTVSREQPFKQKLSIRLTSVIMSFRWKYLMK